MIRSDCEAQVKGFSGARYKKFSTKNEALEFISAAGDPYNKPTTSEHKISKKKAVASKAPKVNKSKKAKYEVACSYQNEFEDSDDDLSFLESDDDIDKYDRIKDQIKRTVDKQIQFSFSKLSNYLK